jgi:hypothetical protein
MPVKSTRVEPDVRLEGRDRDRARSVSTSVSVELAALDLALCGRCARHVGG